MKIIKRPVTFLVADDDAEDRMMLKEAFTENRLANNLIFVENGEELVDYLLCKGPYNNTEKFPRPGLIILDLNMPKKDGREALKEIKLHPALRHIPIVIMTTSKTEEDIIRSYGFGVNSFITKPVKFESLVAITKELGRYWLEIVELPIHHGSLT